MVKGRFKCPSGCGKIFISEACANLHANTVHIGGQRRDNHNKRKGWATPFGFGDFTDPVTYDEACELMKKMTASFDWSKK